MRLQRHERRQHSGDSAVSLAEGVNWDELYVALRQRRQCERCGLARRTANSRTLRLHKAGISRLRLQIGKEGLHYGFLI